MLTSLELANHFGFNVISGDMNSLQRPVRIAKLDRPGVELLGIFHFFDKSRIQLIGNKEIALINDSDPDFVFHNCMKIFVPECPAIIITQGNSCPEPVLRAAKEANAPLFSSHQDTSTLSSDMYVYLSEALAPKTALHAVLMEIYGIGVLILGESGIGKSEISLDLIRRGHRLIADDRVDISDVRGTLIGTCPESISGMMEVRGIGIISVERIFGVNSLADKTAIRLVINLVPFKKEEPLERIGMKTDSYEILGETVPLIKLPVSAARSMSEIVETAVTNFKLKDFGYDTGYEFQKRLSELHQKVRRQKNLSSNSALNAMAAMNVKGSDKFQSHAEPYSMVDTDVILPQDHTEKKDEE